MINVEMRREDTNLSKVDKNAKLMTFMKSLGATELATEEPIMRGILDTDVLSFAILALKCYYKYTIEA